MSVQTFVHLSIMFWSLLGVSVKHCLLAVSCFPENRVLHHAYCPLRNLDKMSNPIFSVKNKTISTNLSSAEFD